nr:DsbA family oxidoreductase [Kofleriaceae bacterium]
MTDKLDIDVWSDIACPWCYIGKRHLEGALATFEHAGDVHITWHSFELDPKAPRAYTDGLTYAQRLARKYQVTPEDGEKMIGRVVETGAKAGLELRYDRVQGGNTFDAHRLLQWALATTDKQGALKEHLMRAYMTDGAAIGDRDTLSTIAGAAGLDVAAARAMLDTDDYGEAVRADEALAHQLNITAVPFFVMAHRIAVPGAQPIDTLAAMLAKAWPLAGATGDDASDG